MFSCNLLSDYVWGANTEFAVWVVSDKGSVGLTQALVRVFDLRWVNPAPTVLNLSNFMKNWSSLLTNTGISYAINITELLSITYLTITCNKII